MKIAMFVNDIAGEHPKYTTTWLAREATARGHEVWYIEVGGFAYDPDDMVRASARRVPDGEYTTAEEYLGRPRRGGCRRGVDRRRCARRPDAAQ
jgi:glutathione synthase/RimK-type ligase-like ATP-grasp enzyme